MKKWDKIIIISLLVVSFLPYLVFGLIRVRDYNATYAVITIAGKPYDKIKLTGHKGETQYLIETPNGNNLVLIKDEEIAVIDADCPDGVCTESGFVKKPGQSLICLPHKLSIAIEGVQLESDGLDAMAS
ncbi:MAG: NusG domain II-containing protein [Cellulosilyticaceae bacterium]